MKNFIVPVDFSADSLKGLETALLFARKKEVNIQMVYVQKKSEDYRPGTFEEELHYAEKEFEALLKKYKSDLHHDSKLRYIIKAGRIYEEVVKQTESYKESMVCASTHGASGFEEFFIGSNAFKIISATRNPVITVRKRVPKDIKRIVVPLKLDVDTRQKVPFCAEIADVFGSEIHLLTVSTTKNIKDQKRLNAYLAQSADYLRRRRVPFITKKFTGESLASLVTNYCEAVDADLVTVMTGGKSNFSVLLGSFAQQMLYRSDIPVLSITAREKHLPAGFATGGYLR